MPRVAQRKSVVEIDLTETDLERLRRLARKLEARVRDLQADLVTLEAAITAMRRRYPMVGQEGR